MILIFQSKQEKSIDGVGGGASLPLAPAPLSVLVYLAQQSLILGAFFFGRFSLSPAGKYQIEIDKP
jgi:hypothetical protein